MRRSRLRFASAAVLAGLCSGLVVVSDRFLAAQPVKAVGQPGKKDADKDKKDDRPASDADLPIGLPYDRDAKQQLKAARDYLEFKEIPWNTVCPLLQNILDTRSDSFFNIEYKVGARTEVMRISVKTEANRIIAAFPKEGLQFYQQAYGQDAAKLLDDAVKANYDPAMLADLSQRYFHTKAGAEGTVLLATIHLERGNYLEAAYSFERLLSRPDSDDVLTARTLFKAALAFRRSGDAKHAELYKAVWERLEKATVGRGLTFGRKNFTTAELKAELERDVVVTRAGTTVGEWAMWHGNPARSGTVEGGPPFLDPAFPPVPMFYTAGSDAAAGVKDELEKLYNRDDKGQKGVPLPGFFPITTPELVIFRAYDGVHAVATRDHVHRGHLVKAGERRWSQGADFGHVALWTTGNDFFDDPSGVRAEVTKWWNTYKSGHAGSVLHENPLIGTLAHDGTNVYFVDDLAVPPPPALTAPEFGGMAEPQFKQSGPLANAVRAGQLVAVNLHSGGRAWELGRVDRYNKLPPNATRLSEDEADKTTSAFQLCLDAVFLGPPLPLNGRLYVLIEQAGAIRLLCLDPKNLVAFPGWPRRVPTLVWSQKLGKPNLALPGDAIRRYQGAFLAASDGIIVCPTNSGAVIAVDIMSRSLLWAHAYRKPLDPPKVRFNNNGQPIPPELLKDGRWHAAGPLITGGKVLLAAYDSDYLECLDLRTGKLVWKTPRESSDLYVGGVANDKVIIVGREELRAYHLDKTDPASPGTPLKAWGGVKIPTPTGHGVVGKTTFYVPVRQPNAGKDTTPAAEIWAINVETGAVEGKPAARRPGDAAELARYGLGNLAFQDGIVFSQSPWEVAAYPQLEQKKAEMNRRLAANPKDPAGLTDRGELYLDEGKDKLKLAIADFKEAKQNNPPEAVARRLREKLYVAYTELLRLDFAAAEPFLTEYEALCEVPLDTDDEFEKARRKEETGKRKRLRLYLLAKGREGQGRLAEAFDHYRDLARSDEGAGLLDDPDNPAVKLRPDVLARGRIEGMIRRAADPAGRKALEDRVAKEWAAVGAENDLKRLKQFVGLFGPYFPAGAEAQLRLADALLATHEDADAREAQMLLGQVRATADDPAVRARATELLARLMVKNGLMEDAVGLYIQLGKEFPNVPVRDGKTGADFLNDLLTDKRMLPYLEPTRHPLPGRVKAEQRDPGGPAGNYGGTFEIEPEGDLLPMYRRLRFVVDLNASGNGRWAIRAIDRATGIERCKFTNLEPVHNLNVSVGNMPWSRFVQANGHLLLVQLGSMVYCLDLAEKKEVWHRNLLGENPDPNQAGWSPETPGVPSPEGEFNVKTLGGYVFTLGRCAVLQPGYVALLTREGLEVIEPTTRTQLWIRRGIPERTHVYGDGRYILLVETNSNRQVTGAKVLRAVDGMPVEGAPDSGAVLAAAKSFRVYGHTVLLHEGSGDQPRVIRLYDPATGKDVWKKEYDPKAVPVRSADPEWTGYVRPDGEVDLVAVRTGRPLGKFRLDEKQAAAHLDGAAEAHLLADPERFFLAFNHAAAAGPIYQSTFRTLRVNGPLYCFDRATGKRLWYADELFENQQLILEQFHDLPVIVAASPMADRNGGGAVYKVVVVEKERGKVRFNRGLTNSGIPFHGVTVDLKNGTVDLHRNDTRVHIGPDDPAGP